MNLVIMSFESVLDELRARRKLPPERLGVTEADIQKWSVSAGVSRSELYDRIAIWLARGFHRSELEFQFCDVIVNNIHGLITTADENRPDLFWGVFLAFDSGEFYRKDDRRDPVQTYTRPLIAKIVEKYTSTYPDV